MWPKLNSELTEMKLKSTTLSYCATIPIVSIDFWFFFSWRPALIKSVTRIPWCINPRCHNVPLNWAPVRVRIQNQKFEGGWDNLIVSTPVLDWYFVLSTSSSRKRSWPGMEEINSWFQRDLNSRGKDWTYCS